MEIPIQSADLYPTITKPGFFILKFEEAKYAPDPDRKTAKLCQNQTNEGKTFISIIASIFA